MINCGKLPCAARQADKSKEELLPLKADKIKKELQEAIVAALFGEIPFQGICPFKLIPDIPLQDIVEEP